MKLLKREEPDGSTEYRISHQGIHHVAEVFTEDELAYKRRYVAIRLLEMRETVRIRSRWRESYASFVSAANRERFP